MFNHNHRYRLESLYRISHCLLLFHLHKLSNIWIKCSEIQLIVCKNLLQDQVKSHKYIGNILYLCINYLYLCNNRCCFLQTIFTLALIRCNSFFVCIKLTTHELARSIFKAPPRRTSFKFGFNKLYFVLV